MNRLISFHNSLFGLLETSTQNWLLPTLARLIFAGTLAVYFWKSALTKLGSGIFGFLRPSDGAYVQIFPKAFEAAGYDSSAFGFYHWFVAMAGTYAEFLLPLFIVIGFLTRLTSLGMIFFILVMSFVDISGHGLGAADIGRWFDGNPSSLIVDQRAMWIFILLVLVIKGPGPIAADTFVLKPRKTE